MVANVMSAEFEPQSSERRAGPMRSNWPCLVCYEQFDGPREFRWHQQESNHWHCAYCDTTLSGRVALLDHCKITNCAPYICTMCATHFTTLTRLATHANIAHGSRRGGAAKSEVLAESGLLSTEVTEESTSARAEWEDEEAPHEIGDRTRRLHPMKLRSRTCARKPCLQKAANYQNSTSQPEHSESPSSRGLCPGLPRVPTRAPEERPPAPESSESDQSSCLPTVRTGDAWGNVSLPGFDEAGESALEENSVDTDSLESEPTSGNRTPSLSRSILNVSSSRSSHTSLFELSGSRSEIHDELIEGLEDPLESLTEWPPVVAPSFLNQLIEMLVRIHVMIFCTIGAYSQRFLKHVFRVLNEEPPRRLSARNELCLFKEDIS